MIKLTIGTDDIGNTAYSMQTIPMEHGEQELDFQRQDFEQEWQEAWTREELANAILFGIKPNDINWNNYDIRNQARDFGDLNYVKQEWKEHFDRLKQEAVNNG